MSNIYSSDNTSSSKEAETESLNDMLRENIQDFSETDNISEIVLSIVWQGNKLGTAYYDFDTDHLYLMPDHSESAPFFTMLRLLLMQIQPHCVIVSSKTDKKVINIIKETCTRRSTGSISRVSGFSSESCNVIILPNIDFAYESSRHHLQSLDLPNIPQNMNDVERRIYFSSLIDFTSACMVKAAGGLLKFIGKKCLNLGHEQAKGTVLGISTFSLKNIVNIDENTYRALQIFQDERHPSVYKNSMGAKEGLSLYGICNKCKCGIGKKELKRWFLLPTNDISVICERQKAVKFFSLAKNIEIVSSLQSSLRHIKYLPKIFNRMKTGQASLNDWRTLYKTAYHAMVIGEVCRSHSSSLEIFKDIGEAFSIDLFRVASLLDKVIDFEEYARQNHFAVKPGVDSEIDKMKRIYNGLPDFMTQVAHQELQQLHSDIEQCSVIYLPQLGYLLAIPSTHNMKESKEYSLPNLKFMFVLNDTVHYKSASTRKLDVLLGDTLCEIYDKETQIMHKLQNMILEMRPVFFTAMELLSKLDCLISLAMASKEFNWVQPEMFDGGDIAVLKARHPLQELCVASFVANDIFSGGSDSKIKILTAPNSSGKSTYLKQVALISFMAHLGSFVPAQSAKIPFLDSIFSCIQSAETVSISLSSFLISLNQLSCCLNDATRNSLIVVDEFGKDTDARSGLSLLTASIKFWIQKENASPHVFIATHYLAINSSLPVTPSITFKTIDMVLNEELVFFYEIIDGIAVSSYASHAALQAGLSDTIIQRSVEITNHVAQNQSISLNESANENQKFRKYLRISDALLGMDIDSGDVNGFMKLVKGSAKKSKGSSNSSGISSKIRNST